MCLCLDVDSAGDEKDKAKSVLGHVSILLDVAVSEKYIITADRDEKIRVSLREKPFVINNFLLGHTEFVCKIIPLNNNYLISSSGDGTLCFWNVDEGLQLSKCSISNTESLENSLEETKNSLRQSVPALITYDENLNLLAVGNVGLKDNVILVYEILFVQPYLRKCYEINLPVDQHLIDISFDCSNNELSTVFALVQCEEKLMLSSYSCNSVVDNLKLGNCNIIYVNSVLDKLTVSDERQLHVLQLFKTTVPGHTYDAFYKKKNNQFKKDKKAKKVKLED